MISKRIIMEQIKDIIMEQFYYKFEMMKILRMKNMIL